MYERAHSSRLQAINRFLNRVDVRVVLSIAIILSLLPYGWANNAWTSGLYFVIFGAEFSLRCALAFRGGWSEEDDDYAGDDAEIGWRRPPASHLVLLVLDFLALISFLPISMVGTAAARWFRLFRLSRMLLLIGYWAPLVRDVRGVMLRRERARQVVLMGFIVVGLSFAGAVILEHIAARRAVDFSGDGTITAADNEFLTRLWWAFRQIQDPGNMIGSPEETAAVVISLALTVVGLFMVSFLIGLGTDVVRELMTLSRLRPPGLRGHTVVVNIQPSTRPLLDELMRFYRKLLPEGRFGARWIAELFANTRRGIRGPRYVVVGRTPEAPDFLREPALASIIYRQGDSDAASFFERSDVKTAQRVVLLANLEAQDPDAETIRTLLTLVERFRDRDRRTRSPLRRARLLIAEILDESNIPAARAAITQGESDTRAFVVPSERLIALFIACIARRPGVGRLLRELLTSQGHELYTCFFEMPGLGYACESHPSIPGSPQAAMRYLVGHGRQRPSDERVIPVGVFFQDGDGPAPSDTIGSGVAEGALSLSINPTRGGSPRPAVGFVALAPSFSVVREFTEELRGITSEAAAVTTPGDAEHYPQFERAEVTQFRKVLICGFRSATVSLIEALLNSEPEAEILVLVLDDDGRKAALDDFDAHSNLVRKGVLRGRHGMFLPAEDDEDGVRLAYCHRGDEDLPRGRVHLHVGDWGSSRRLVSLPEPFAEVGNMDAVILTSSEKAGSDSHTVKTLMKLHAIGERGGEGGPRGPRRIVAEVLDRNLAHHLRERYERLRERRIHVYSIEELRALFMFQSVVVPRFDMVYSELMGPWGQSFVQLRPAEQGSGVCSFEALAKEFDRQGKALIGVEMRVGDELRLLLGEGEPDADDRIDLARLEAVWVIGNDGPQGRDAA